MKQIMTVNGLVDSDQLGFTMMHEHIFTDLSWTKNRYDTMSFNDDELMKDEVMLYHEAGGKTLVDVTLEHIGRNPVKLKWISNETKLNIVMGCGYYRSPFYPDYINKKSTNKITEIILNEIKYGVDETGIKPGIIGEIGLDKSWVEGDEERVLRAAARAQIESGLALTTHTPCSSSMKFFELFKEEGVSENKVIFGHMDNTLEYDYLVTSLDTGAYIQFDLIGIDFINKDESRAKMVKKLIDAGYEKQLLLSLDMPAAKRLAANGGTGYSHLINVFIPLLIKLGVTDKQIKQITENNPVDVLAI